MTIRNEIFDMFKSGVRINVKSFRRYSDYNVYCDCKLVRIYYVHRFKKSSPLDVISEHLTNMFGIGEIEAINHIVDFINDFPNFWEYRNEPEFSIDKLL